jgi:hypothetical protein
MARRKRAWQQPPGDAVDERVAAYAVKDLVRGLFVPATDHAPTIERLRPLGVELRDLRDRMRAKDASWAEVLAAFKADLVDRDDGLWLRRLESAVERAEAA